MKKSMSTQEIVNGLSEILVEDPKSEARDPEKTYPGTPDLFWGLKASPVAWTFSYGGLVKSKLQFLIKKKYQIFFHLSLFSVFGHQNPGSGMVVSR